MTDQMPEEGGAPQEGQPILAETPVKKEPTAFEVLFFERSNLEMEERPWAISHNHRHETSHTFSRQTGEQHKKGQAFPKDVIDPPSIELGNAYNRTYAGCKSEDPCKKYIHVQGHWRYLPMEVLDQIGKYAVVKVYGWVESYYGDKENHPAKYWLVDTKTWLVLIECLAGRSARRARRLLKSEAAMRHGEDLLAPPEYDDEEDEWV
jgi:hypothetical protein